MTNTFSKTVLKWFHQHGRHDLPWQKNTSAYRVWISEIMLQQTQVTTVIPYFKKFIARFPSIKSLALSNQDDVLALWSGLGYYARARHLHQSAKIISEKYHGRFPTTLDDLIQLPGIGKSTAGAILSLAMKKQASILDGNVKRVLTRYFAIEGWPGKSEIIKQLWEIADSLTPANYTHHYNQAMMDLGAMICTHSQPKCDLCPLHSSCKAHKLGQESDYPRRKIKKTRPIKSTIMLIFCNEHNQILLEKRPQYGIWGGLWSFPECENQDAISKRCNEYAFGLKKFFSLKKIQHQFSHYQLNIEAYFVYVKPKANTIRESRAQIWHDLKNSLPGGIPQPIKKLLAEIENRDIQNE